MLYFNLQITSLVQKKAKGDEEEKQEERNNEKNAKENRKEKKKTKGKEVGRKDATGKEGSKQQKKTSRPGNARNPKPRKETGGIGDRRLFVNVAPWNVTSSVNFLFQYGSISSAPSGDYIHNIHRKWWFDYTLLEQHHG